MKAVLASIALMVSVSAPVSACIVGISNLTFEQWYPYCAAEIDQTCNSPTFQIFPNCRDSMARSMYTTYMQSQIMPFCGQRNAGAQMCRNGYVSTCNGTQWMTTSQQCGG